MTNNSTSNSFQMMTSGLPTSGFTLYAASTDVNTATFSFTLDATINIELGVNNHIQFRLVTNGSPYKVQLNITEIPTSYTVIQNTIENNFVNPPTS